MRINVSAILLALAFFAALLVLVAPVSAVNANFTPVFDSNDQVHVNVSSHLDTSGTTPFEVWAAAGILGIILFFASLGIPASTAENERNAIISVISWVPIGFTAYASFAVDRLTGFGVTGLIESQAAEGAINSHEYVLLESHTIYAFDVLGILFAIFFIIAIVNTIRIIALHKALRLESDNSGMGRGQDSV